MAASSSSSGAQPNGASGEFQQRQHITDDYHRFLSTASLATCVLAPVIIALPPRKLDLYSFSLAGAFVVSANYQLKERTGRGIVERARMPHIFGMPEQAREIQLKMRAQEEKRLLEESPSATTQKKSGSLLEGKAKELWMGGETEGWKERRLREEQEKLANGEGYGSMIVDQIWEVWNWGKVKDEDEEEQPEKNASSKGVAEK
ncbi:hypothetical protein HRR83_001423 [Exophiala dermatitidis]|uniref:Rhomboid family membrane protein n=1 Tax=Exophiala dermatitidis TaxID=5970 RepID=A0AAN6IXV6_EXODE|nr:hypothetical protein HRR75_001313 [Exophiala dermatitidis]KAJ4526232.1 hypothetical protein HRR74_001427 [Exophiala dermatitidis]KAJ4526826.1 hypothetical protein HRR73_001621 [Exophiala dermatitidis]KAJ4532534.1 hypothetical protein HRR76_007523 [Exophiala dermatitidis]KAJ4546956.1 hypothetical protein HRR77_004496 [Exophiala dermatitidis]